MKTTDFLKLKNQRKISMVTCYDYTFASIVNETDIDAVLIGDSVAMVSHGYHSTVFADVSMLVEHTRAVAKGITNKVVISDLPFLSYQKGDYVALTATEKLVKAGAHMIKLEGVDYIEKVISKIVAAGVPVMGHLGLTPQSINKFGGHRVQAKEDKEKQILLDDAKRLEDAGVSSIVLECVPFDIAKKITETVNVTTIGIGAGSFCDGQVLVISDLLGLNDAKFTFLRKFLDAKPLVKNALNQYDKEVKNATFPNQEESFK